LSRSHHSAEFEYLRVEAGLSHQEAADFFGVTVRTVFRYESGESRPSPLAIRWLKEHVENGKRPSGRNEAFRFIDLFAGIGGLRLAFEAIGGRCVFTSEWDKYAQKTYIANFGSHEVHGDVRPFSANPSLIPRHDVLVAGFPCQPFSIAGVSKKNALGRPHGFLCDTQGTLFFDLAKVIAHHRPPAFLLENVRNLERHDRGRTFATIKNVLENELGYQVQYRVVSSEPWVPQKRERIFIVGFRDKSQFDFAELEIPDSRPKLGSILESHDLIDPKYTLTAHLWKYLRDYKKKHASQGNGFGYSLFGPEDVTRTLSARYFKDGSEVLVAQPNKRPRRLTPRECARLMGFDGQRETKFKIPVSDTQAYKQFGNAVVVPAAKAVAKLMLPHISAALAARPKARKNEQLPLLDSVEPTAIITAHG
jgi:DNA (cytosine-5)-methyltransferase 1